MTINYATLQNTLFPAATDTPQTLRKCADGILESYGKTVPPNGSSGYVPGCVFIHTDGTNDTVRYVNEGTATSCDFNSINQNVADTFGTASNRGPSPAIWEDCPVLDLMTQKIDGFFCFEDFILGPEVANNKAAHIQGQVSVYTDANDATIKLLADETVGAVSLAGATNDNEDATIALGGITGACYAFSETDGKAFWLEARLKKTATDAAKLQWFFGLIQEGCLAADGVMVATPTMAAKDYVGFYQVEGDTTKVDTVHNIGATGITQVKNEAVTIVANTYVKLGMKFNPTTLVLTFYADGVPLADTVLASATNFPKGEEMCPVIGVRTATGTTPGDLTVDWIRCAWLR